MKTLKLIAGAVFLLTFIFACQKDEDLNFPESQASLKAMKKPITEKKCEKPDKDKRDGQYYSGVMIGTQCWMSRNLAYLPEVSPSSEGSDSSPYYYVYGYEGYRVKDALKTDNYLTYGVLYNWPAAMNGEPESNAVPSGVRGICPDGWHLPSDAEWKILTDYLGSSAHIMMKSTSGWKDGGNGDNSSGLNGLPGGFRDPIFGGFFCLTLDGYFWAATTWGSGSQTRGLHYDLNIVSHNNLYRQEGISIRCLKD